ncbi:MAG: YgiQ family radical SAM protein [Candidatus Omnitrophica bacterium CG1_02_40_15]|nr:MAG: YgiQ family radical SAM protein [Candidatus Omnitrophica bacterium CG1_02_40_15]
MNTRFLPICKQDMKEKGWDELDIILITGDAYVDHPSFGAAVIARVLESAGFKVGIIAQPDWKTSDDFLKLGKPRLFFGITAGNMDSILSNYTINRSKRKQDDYSPGGKIGLRPNRATIVYANKVRELFPDTPIVLGGIEASLRRLAHYDFWSDAVRRSILLDAKADLLVYGMGEKQIVEVANRLQKGEDIKSLDNIRGTVIIKKDISGLKNYLEIPFFEEIEKDKDKFNEAFRLFYLESDPVRGKTIAQKHGDRFVIQLPPEKPLTYKELDDIYLFDYARLPHPSYDKEGGVPGFETVKNSIISHRGCSGECSFCSLGIHQGRIIQSRSRESIVKEIEILTQQKYFKGTITDIGGPTANLYAADCKSWERRGACKDKKCLMPSKCQNLKLGYDETLSLWDRIKKIKGVKHIFIGSGLRYDLLTDKQSDRYLKALCREHVSGYLKVAPEHTVDKVLELMNKPGIRVYERFVKRFQNANRELGKKQFIVNYFITSHPGADKNASLEMARYLSERKIRPEQIQDFIPLPMTVSAAMYWTGKNPMTGENVYVPKDIKERKWQRALIQPTNNFTNQHC